ncbi:hypothetical protein CIB93_31885 [Streptomyces sp. WZ.A104]|uniref:hypothetical protein n=1 Tax=Streptomyces sp. WZ.A104 TaxID=2023771 RepID=UPI000BBC826A|nr:hypothetical protein [Streptomyces sp. WZ.A104]PCG82107.1 hypothetical protein CIB93_31885 [Streptomyces sp. WZ.A104]
MPTCLAIGRTAAADPPGLPQDLSPGLSPDDQRHRSTTFYEEVVRPACEQLGLTFVRADRLTEAGLPGEQLQRMVTEADVVIADLGAPDAELAFGLGVRHALGRCTVHVTETADGPSGPAGVTPHIAFPAQSADAAGARRQLIGVLTATVGGLTATVGGQTVPALPAAPAEPCVQTAAEPDEESPGLFDLVVEAEAQMEAITGDMEDVESALADLAAMMELITEDMARVSHPGATMGAKLTVIHRLAQAIDGPADDLEAAAERFAGRMEASMAALRAFLEWAEATPRGEWPEGAEELLTDVAGAPWDMRSAAVAFQEVLSLIDLFAASSRRLRGPARRVGTSLRTIFGSVAVLEELQAAAAKLKGS